MLESKAELSTNTGRHITELDKLTCWNPKLNCQQNTGRHITELDKLTCWNPKLNCQQTQDVTSQN